MSLVGSVSLESSWMISSSFGGAYSYEILLFTSSWSWERPKDNFLWYNLEALLSRTYGGFNSDDDIDDDSEVNSGNDSELCLFELINEYNYLLLN